MTRAVGLMSAAWGRQRTVQIALIFAASTPLGVLWAQSGVRGDPTIIDPTAVLERLFTGALFTEGPAQAPDGSIYFSDITVTKFFGNEAGRIWRFGPRTGSASVYRKVDQDGNLYLTVPGERQGIRVFSPEGTKLAFIPTPESPRNVKFGRGADARTLFIAAGKSLYRIRVKRAGFYPGQ